MAFPKGGIAWNKGLKGYNPPGCYRWQKGDNLGPKHPRWKEPVEIKCTNCAKVFYKKPWQLVKHGKGHYTIGFFCSRECRRDFYHKNLKGRNNPRYVGGKLTYYGARWTEAKQKARERDNFTCRICKRKRRNIHVHHIMPYQYFTTAEEANRLENLICVCSHCHPKLTFNQIATTFPLL